MIRKLFNKMKIRRKVLTRMKYPPGDEANNKEELIEFFNTFKRLDADSSREFFQIDETIFAVTDFQQKAWSLPNNHINVGRKVKKAECIAAVVAISSIRGLCHYKLKLNSFDGIEFAKFIEELWTFAKPGDIAFMDQCKIHHSNVVQKCIKQKTEFQLFFNRKYRPDLHGIESFFNLAKQEFKKKLLDAMLGTETVELKEVVESSLHAVPNDSIKNCAQHVIYPKRNAFLDTEALTYRHDLCQSNALKFGHLSTHQTSD